MKIEKLTDGTHKVAGSYDNARRWYPDPEYRVDGTFDVRSPSRAWPFSYLKHFYTVKYARKLFDADPYRYMDLQGIKKTSETGKALVAHYAARRIS